MEIKLFLEIKSEFTDQLSDILTPFIWEGMNSIYKSAANDAIKTENEDKTLLIFQKYLQKVSTWNQLQIDDETNRIKTASNTIDYLDDLVKAVIKANITLFTYSNSNSTTISQAFYDNIKTSSFIHLCYIECAKEAHNNPFLFYHDVAPMDLKRNQLVIHQNIEQSIGKAIKKMLPLKIILKEYMASSLNLAKSYAGVELVGTNIPRIVEQNAQQSPEKNIIKTNISPKKMSERKFLNGEPPIVDQHEYVDNLFKKVKSASKISSPTKNKKLNKKLMSVMSDINLKSVKSLNKPLNKSDRDILNIDNIATNVDSNSNVSDTTFSSNLFLNKNYPDIETDAINPNNVNLIEDYGKRK